MNKVAAAIALATLLLLGACSPAPEAAELVPDLRSFTWEELSAADQAQLVQDAEMMREEYGIGDEVPTPDVVRVVAMAESPEAHAQCLRERGLNAEVEPIELGVKVSSDESQNEAVMLGFFECAVMFPIRPDQFHYMPDEVIERSYIYDTVTNVQCLKEQGIDVPGSPPSFEVWKQTGVWQELEDVYFDPTRMTPDERQALRLACPYGAPPEVLYVMPKPE